jgi:hypothetical protein
MRVEVEAYAGYKADERPLLFRMGDREYRVQELLDKWYGPEDTWFKVRADDGGLYILRLNPVNGWTLESYRGGEAEPSER